MAWYGVHVVMAVRFKDGKQKKFPAWENVYLIQAADSKEAEEKGMKIGKENEGDSSGTFHWNNVPASWEFVGIRKVLEISNARSAGNKPEDGVEVTYQTVEFTEEDALQNYAEGGAVSLKVID
jgi:hypothetical protein